MDIARTAGRFPPCRKEDVDTEQSRTHSILQSFTLNPHIARVNWDGARRRGFSMLAKVSTRGNPLASAAVGRRGRPLTHGWLPSFVLRGMRCDDTIRQQALLATS